MFERERGVNSCLCLQTEKARHILQVRQKKLDMLRLRQVVKMPSDKELSKKSDEHKALLAQKCVDLLMRKAGSQEEISEVRIHAEVHVCIILRTCLPAYSNYTAVMF